MNKLAEKVKSLFTEDLVKLVIGFEKGSHGAGRLANKAVLSVPNNSVLVK